jgi:hypothetical protein
MNTPRIARPQADAIVQALMAADLKVQAERARRHADEALQSKRQRRAAGSALLGMALGAALRGPLEVHFAQAVLWSGLIGAGGSWIVADLLARRDREAR